MKLMKHDTMSSYLDLYTMSDIAQEYGLTDDKFKRSIYQNLSKKNTIVNMVNQPTG